MIQLALAAAILLLASFVLAWTVAKFAFSPADHSEFDTPRPSPTGKRTRESDAHREAAAEIREGLAEPPPAKGKAMLRLLRDALDERGEAFPIAARVTAVDAGGVPAEWVCSADASPDRRMLYIHGGGYMTGSPKSHRPITNRLSEISKSAVLAIDYRLMPEHRRIAGIEDCRAAYRWLLEHGPDGIGKPDVVFVAGDSSGGNLALSTIAWARDNRLRQADAVVALCPQTDATLSSPSLIRNVDTDVMQGKSFGPAVKAPKMVSRWIAFLIHRIRPSHPMVSPLLGDLSNLPPTLLQVSEAEMFLDDSIRYANKANTQGSVAVVQTWPFMIHVWHAFPVPEADEAFAEIANFLHAHAPHAPLDSADAKTRAPISKQGLGA